MASLSLAQLVSVARRVGANPQQAALAAAIAMGESSGRVNAIGDSGNSRGLWQVYGPAHPQFNRSRLLSDPVYAAQAMKSISENFTDWHPWTIYNTGAYRRYLPAAQRAARGGAASFPSASRPTAPAPTGEAPAPADASGLASLIASMQKPAGPPMTLPQQPSFSARPVTAGMAPSLPDMTPQPKQDISALLSAIGGLSGGQGLPGLPSAPGESRTPLRGSARLPARRGGIVASHNWGGTLGVLNRALDVGKRLGFPSPSGKRTPQHNAAVGGASNSDHLTTNTNAYAWDFPTSNGTRLAQSIARAYGVRFIPNSYSSGGTVRASNGRQYRIQILWGSGIDHGDHVHVGARLI